METANKTQQHIVKQVCSNNTITSLSINSQIRLPSSRFCLFENENVFVGLVHNTMNPNSFAH